MEIEISDARGRLKAEINPLKEQAIITHFNTDKGRNLTAILDDALEELNEKRVTKVYLQIPCNRKDIKSIIEKYGFVAETFFPYSLVKGKEILSGLEHVYFLGDDRIANKQEQAEMEAMLAMINCSKPRRMRERIIKLREEGYRIRKAAPRDAEEIYNVHSSVFLYNDGLETTIEDIKTSFHKGDFWLVCRNPKGKIVGTASADLNDYESDIFGCKSIATEIDDAAVLPEERDKGIMSAIMHTIAKKIRANGLMPHAYCTEQIEAIHHAAVNAGFYPCGFSHKTNRLVLKDNPDFPKERYNNNIVYFKF